MRTVITALSWPIRWWRRQSLRARLTLIATALFTVAVATGAVLLLVLQRYALLRVLDSSADGTASAIARQWSDGAGPTALKPTSAGVIGVQVVSSNDVVLASSPGADKITSLLTPAQLETARQSSPLDIVNPANRTTRLRVLARPVGQNTVLVTTDLSRVDDSLRILSRAALIGGPLAVLLMAAATYGVVALTLRPVASLRHGADDITGAGLADQRLPVPASHDEIARLAVTLNAMLDRLDSATSRQRTFVGDAAHELRSPIASLRVQVEVAQRLGPEEDWPALMSDMLIDVERLDRLVEDLLALARTDEAAGGLRRIEPVDLGELVRGLHRGYAHARVPVHVEVDGEVTVSGDPDALRRVAINLIDNALRYARTGVDVVVARAENDLDAGGLDASALDSRGPVVRLIVTDDGQGIPPNERGRVFDRFYRVNVSRSRESGGTGLGLPIVRDLVRAHGGTVWLTDTPTGQGLRAIVTLPADVPEPD